MPSWNIITAGTGWGTGDADCPVMSETPLLVDHPIVNTGTQVNATTATIQQALTAGPALKFDTAKVRLELLSVPAMEAIAEVMTFGARKYAAHNWRKGFEWSRLFGALLRHTFAAMRGEDRDPESGLLHLAHAGCCVMFLLEHVLCKLGTDDRYKSIVVETIPNEVRGK